MATAFARLGSRVTLIEALPRLLPAAEPEASVVADGGAAPAGRRRAVGVRAVGPSTRRAARWRWRAPPPVRRPAPARHHRAVAASTAC
jgi:hypothetical protein